MRQIKNPPPKRLQHSGGEHRTKKLSVIWAKPNHTQFVEILGKRVVPASRKSWLFNVQLCLDIRDDLFPGLGGFWEHGRQQWEAVHHALPDTQGHLHTKGIGRNPRRFPSATQNCPYSVGRTCCDGAVTAAPSPPYRARLQLRTDPGFICNVHYRASWMGDRGRRAL